MIRWAAPALTFLSGFISLSYELIWVRVFATSLKSSAHAFPLLLGCFLLGVAAGSSLSTRLSTRHASASLAQLRTIALFVLAGALVSFACAPLMSWIASLGGGLVVLSLLPVTLASALLGAQLPLISHWAIEADRRAGAGVSYLYFGNILGSVLGSAGTGFVLMDHLGTAQLSMALALMGLALALALALVVERRASLRLAAVALVALAAGAIVAGSGPLYEGFWERLHFQSAWRTRAPLAQVIESHSGVVAVDAEGTVYGTGVFDGRFKTGLRDLENGNARVYAISAFHPAPKRVLAIGLGSGSWGSIALDHPQLEEMTVVEINGGYLDALKRHPEQARLLEDPRVRIVVDDARRWLHTHDERYDLILCNNSQYFTAGATNLLSREFYELARAHLKPDGVMMSNSTNYTRVFATALSVFDDVWRFWNFVIASPSTIDVDPERMRRTLLAYRDLDNKPVLDPTRAGDAEVLRKLMSIFSERRGRALEDDFVGVQDRESLVEHYGDLAPITDDNLGGEFSRPPLGGDP